MWGERRRAVVLLALAMGLASCDLSRNGLEDLSPTQQSTPDASSTGAGDATTGVDSDATSGADSGATTDAGGASETSVASDAAMSRDTATSVDAAPPFCDPSDATLLLCLRFENVVHDESANALTPTSSSVVFVPGVRGQAARFVPPSSAIVFPNAAIWNVARVTVEGWVRPQTLPTGVARAGILDSDGRFGLFVYAPGTIDCLVQSVHLVGPVLQAAQWTHVACTYDGVAATLYVGGVVKATTPLASAGASAGTTAIGENSPSGDPFDGDIDELRVFSVARTPSEIAAAATP